MNSINTTMRVPGSAKEIWVKAPILAIAGGAAFWVVNFAISLTPIAAEYRSALAISYLPMLLEALLGGLIIGLCVSYGLLRFYDRAPAEHSSAKSVMLSIIVLIVVTMLIEGPAKLLTPTSDSWRLFLIGAVFNVLRILALGIAIGYLYDKLNVRARQREVHMHAVICTAYGSPEVLQLADIPTPVPDAGEVRIRIHATAVTSSDCYVRGLDLDPRYRLLARLALGWQAPRQPILGMVLSGEVDAVGSGVSRFAEDDLVFGFDRHRFGAYAQYVCWSQAALLAPRPANLTHEQAAAIPYGGLLALHFLRRAGVTAGQRVLIYGASGAVGTSAVQLAAAFGAEVTGVCGAANVELVRSLGARRVIDYRSEDFSTGSDRYDLFFDAVGKRKSISALRKAGRVLAPGGRRISVDDGAPKLGRNDLDLLAELAVSGSLRPVIDRVYPLEDIVEAHRYVSGGHKRGNVVITVD